MSRDTTERDRAWEYLPQSEERFRQVIEILILLISFDISAATAGVGPYPDSYLTKISSQCSSSMSLNADEEGLGAGRSVPEYWEIESFQKWRPLAFAKSESPPITEAVGPTVIEEIDSRHRKRYQRWKTELLKTKSGRKLWTKYGNDPHFRLNVKLGPHVGGNEGAVTTGYHWNAMARLDSATILLGPELDSGYPDATYYPVLRSLRPNADEFSLQPETIAAAKIAHELGHIESTATTSKRLFGLRTVLVPIWNRVFLFTGQTRQPGIEMLIGGTPSQIQSWCELEAEAAGTVPFLKDRFPGKPGEHMPRRIRQAIKDLMDHPHTRN